LNGLQDPEVRLAAQTPLSQKASFAQMDVHGPSMAGFVAHFWMPLQ
jgi:hypothetical protein